MSEDVLKLLSKVIITFMLTNIQDVVILMNFFLESSKYESVLKAKHVVLGQYLGFSTLLLLSLIGYIISHVLPIKIFGFLGFLTLHVGLNGLYELYKDLRNKRKSREEKVERIPDIEQIGEEEEIELRVNNIKTDGNWNYCDDIKQIIKVSLLTIANGNDNIAIYVPIFVKCTSWEIVAYSIGFLFMVGVLCFLCYNFIHFPPIYKFAQKYGPLISPFVFIALGIYILIDSKCFPWLIKIIQNER